MDKRETEVLDGIFGDRNNGCPKFALYQWSFTHTDSIMKSIININGPKITYRIENPEAHIQNIENILLSAIRNKNGGKNIKTAISSLMRNHIDYEYTFLEQVQFEDQSRTINGFIEKHEDTVWFHGKGDPGLNELETLMIYKFMGTKKWGLGIISGRCEIHTRPASSIAILHRLPRQGGDTPYFGSIDKSDLPQEARNLMLKYAIRTGGSAKGDLHILRLDTEDLDACHAIP